MNGVTAGKVALEIFAEEEGLELRKSSRNRDTVMHLYDRLYRQGLKVTTGLISVERTFIFLQGVFYSIIYSAVEFFQTSTWKPFLSSSGMYCVLIMMYFLFLTMTANFYILLVLMRLTEEDELYDKL